MSSDLPDAGEWPTLLGGHVRPEIARDLAALKGIYYVPEECLLLVTPRGLVRLMSRGEGSAQWSEGRLEAEVDGRTIVLRPAGSWHPRP